MRQALGIGTRTLRYGQKALAFAVTMNARMRTSRPRSTVRAGRSLVPLPDRDGKPSSAVVWMERGPRPPA